MVALQAPLMDMVTGGCSLAASGVHAERGSSPGEGVLRASFACLPDVSHSIVSTCTDNIGLAIVCLGFAGFPEVSG